MFLENLINRIRHAYRKKFPAKKVLVLEGGGMRGIFLTGVLQAFADRDYFPWKLIIGSSAGALTGAAYAAGQIHLARDAFFTKLLTGEFIHLSNIIRHGKNVLDLDWMVETIIRGEDPLNIKKMKKSAPLIITATNCPKHSTPETIYLNSKKDDIFTALKASSAIPVLYKSFVQYRDFQFLDGALLDPIPYKKALEMGYREEEILVIVTRHKGYRKKEESFWVRTLLESYYKKQEYRHLVDLLNTRYKLYNTTRENLENVHTGIDVIYPPKDFKVDRLTKDEKKILEGFEQGIHEGIVYLKSL